MQAKAAETHTNNHYGNKNKPANHNKLKYIHVHILLDGYVCSIVEYYTRFACYLYSTEWSLTINTSINILELQF